jgi:hypothetical protein
MFDTEIFARFELFQTHGQALFIVPHGKTLVMVSKKALTTKRANDLPRVLTRGATAKCNKK